VRGVLGRVCTVVGILKEMPLFGDAALHKMIPTNAVLVKSCVSYIRGIRIITKFGGRVTMVKC
jgi:hypothetical protein